MTSITIIDELLVLLDDEIPRSLETIGRELSKRSKQTLSSTLGRLIAKGWITRGSGRNYRLYKITRDGQSYVTDHLQAVKQVTEREWDGSWEQVVFNIPERDRKRRDDLRNLLVSLGYGRIHNSLWLSPWNHAKEIAEYVHETESEPDVTCFSMKATSADTNKRIAALFEWDWETLDKEYGDFIDEAKAFLRGRNKTAFDAKVIVFHFAKILANDPKLPANLSYRLTNAKQALAEYELVRPYCYED